LWLLPSGPYRIYLITFQALGAFPFLTFFLMVWDNQVVCHYVVCGMTVDPSLA
jgi:hypothetical protein